MLNLNESNSIIHSQGERRKTYVQKLKAPKIDDLQKVTSQMKDAKLTVIHTGINNIRENGTTEDRVKNLVEAFMAFKETAPDSKIAISKAIPVGNHEIDIERFMFNAENKKKLGEVLTSEVAFLDHGNLAEQGVPIKTYYRDDLVHLSSQGVIRFAQN